MKKVFKGLVSILAVFSLFFASPTGGEKKISAVSQAVVGGSSIGLKLYLDGLLVVGKSDIMSGEGKICPGKIAGIDKGDRITKINGREIGNVNEFCKEIQGSCGSEIALEVIRGDKVMEKNIRPVFYDDLGEYKLGLWVRDSAAGIGTLTYTLSDGSFGALGHGISDVDTKKLIKVKEGEVWGSRIVSVIKGAAGAPGDLKGTINGTEMGEIYKNTNSGIYGTFTERPKGGKVVEIGMAKDVMVGAATIFTNVSKEDVKEYSIEIEKINPFGGSDGKNMVVKITDPELLSQTGGIVQGMSGSPILQNGKLIGAVTHVFVNDPTRGYGIFIENMLSENENFKH